MRVDDEPRVGLIQVTAYGVLPPLTEGQRVAAPLRLSRATGFRNPGTYDYAAHLAREGIYVLATTRADSVTALDDPGPPWPVRVRHESVAAIGRALPPTSAALLAGLLLGDRTELPRDIDDAFRRAGVYHVLAVSGFNVGILAASVWALCRLLRLPHRASAVTAIIVVIGFALVVGPEPSVLRAVVMAVLVLVASLLDRDASVTNSLALAALVILAVRPSDLFDPGFQLSFAATLGIVIAPLPRGMVLGALAVSAAAQLAVLPISLTHFNQLSTIGLIANLGVVPLAGVATVGGLVAVGLSFLSETVAAVAFDAVWPVLLALRGLVALAAKVPGAVLYLPAPGWLAVTCYVGGARIAAGLARGPRSAASRTRASGLLPRRPRSSFWRSASRRGRSCGRPTVCCGSRSSTWARATRSSSRRPTAAPFSSTRDQAARCVSTPASAWSLRSSGTAAFFVWPASPSRTTTAITPEARRAVRRLFAIDEEWTAASPRRRRAVSGAPRSRRSPRPR